MTRHKLLPAASELPEGKLVRRPPGSILGDPLLTHRLSTPSLNLSALLFPIMAPGTPPKGQIHLYLVRVV